MSDIVERLMDACNGHPHAKIPWPHRLLHEAADEIASLRSRLERARQAARNVDCGCTLRERESGHLVDCGMPDLLREIESEGGGDG